MAHSPPHPQKKKQEEEEEIITIVEEEPHTQLQISIYKIIYLHKLLRHFGGGKSTKSMKIQILWAAEIRTYKIKAGEQVD